MKGLYRMFMFWMPSKKLLKLMAFYTLLAGFTGWLYAPVFQGEPTEVKSEIGFTP